MQLDNPETAKNPVLPGGGYGWREEVTLTLVNLNPSHFITSHKVSWGEEIPYTSSDQPGNETLYPSISLHESEAYMNHKFTDGREKTVLLGFKFFDDRNSQMFMQDRAGWLISKRTSTLSTTCSSSATHCGVPVKQQRRLAKMLIPGNVGKRTLTEFPRSHTGTRIPIAGSIDRLGIAHEG